MKAMISTLNIGPPCPEVTEIANSEGNFTILHCSAHWATSVDRCKAIGKKLAVPKDLAENEKFYNVAKDFGRFHLGIRKEEQVGWVDQDGQGLTFENWAPEFPKDGIATSESTVGVESYKNGDGTWIHGIWINMWMGIETNALCV